MRCGDGVGDARGEAVSGVCWLCSTNCYPSPQRRRRYRRSGQPRSATHTRIARCSRSHCAHHCRRTGWPARHSTTTGTPRRSCAPSSAPAPPGCRLRLRPWTPDRPQAPDAPWPPRRGSPRWPLQRHPRRLPADGRGKRAGTTMAQAMWEEALRGRRALRTLWWGGRTHPARTFDKRRRSLASFVSSAFSAQPAHVTRRRTFSGSVEAGDAASPRGDAGFTTTGVVDVVGAVPGTPPGDTSLLLGPQPIVTR
jgi:hypothetical protein